MGVPLRCRFLGYFRRMDIWQLWPIVSAVIPGTRRRFSFHGRDEVQQASEGGRRDDELPWWVYAGLIVAPLVAMIGIMLLKWGLPASASAAG